MQSTHREPTIYEQCIAHGIQIDHHESDLYIRAGALANKLICRHASVELFAKCISSFHDRDGKLWWEVAFAYDPFWPAYQAHQPAAISGEGGGHE